MSNFEAIGERSVFDQHQTREHNMVRISPLLARNRLIEKPTTSWLKDDKILVTMQTCVMTRASSEFDKEDVPEDSTPLKNARYLDVVLGPKGVQAVQVRLELDGRHIATKELTFA